MRLAYDACRDVFVDKDTGTIEPASGSNKPVEAPYVRSDIPSYVSPVTGKVITSRSERREDLARSGCSEADPATRSKYLRNPRFAAKHNMRNRLDPAIRETMDKEQKKELGYT